MQKLYFPPSFNTKVFDIEGGRINETYIIMQRCPVYEKWLEVQDIVGPASEWPRHMRRTFWGMDFTHWRRIQMCVFVWVNGLHPEVFLEWLVTVKANQMGDENYRHIYNLFHYFGAGHYASLYSWNVLQHRYETVSGDPRRYTRM